MNNIETINFFTSSDNDTHNMFVIPFIFSVLYHVKNSFCEILINDSKEFINNNLNVLNIISDEFGDRFLIRDIPIYYNNDNINFKYQHIGQLVRFLEFPNIKLDYTYIGDIDILVLDSNIVNIHKKLMHKQKNFYSNIVRPNSNRLTGCMCVKTTDYYDKIKESIKLFKNDPKTIYYPVLNDEILLYNLIVSSGIDLPKYNSGEYRPIHGIHTSLNRPTPIGDNVNLGWGISNNKLHKYKEFRNTKIFNKVYKHFSSDYIDFVIKQLDKLI